MKATKIVSFVLAVLMLMSVFVVSASAAQTSAYDTGSGITIVYSDVHGWNNVHVHYWGGATASTWPGIVMTEIGTNDYGQKQYSAEVPEGTTGLVFNNGSDAAKDPDATVVPGVAGYYYDTNTNTVKTWGTSQTPTEGETSSVSSGDWYLWGSYVYSEDEATDFGASSTDYNKPTDYGFVNGSLTATFDTDTYVGVKNIKNDQWYMTDGWAGKVDSATLYNTKTYEFTGEDPDTAKDKFFLPAGVELTITMVYDADSDTVTLSYTADGEAPTGYTHSTNPVVNTSGWYLWGSYVYSEDEATDFGASSTDYNKPTDYGFVNGTLTATFDTDTYVGVKNIKNDSWYMTDGWAGKVDSATLYNTKTYEFTGEDPDTAKDKFFLPAGVELTITMVYDADADTVTLSYTTDGEAPTGYTHSTNPVVNTSGWYLWGSYVYSEDEATDFGASSTDYNKPTDYGFVNGTLTATFDTDTYVGVKNIKNDQWYMTDGWAGKVNSATLYNTKTYEFTGEDPDTAKDKFFLPAGVELTITMVYDADADTVTLAYTIPETDSTEDTSPVVTEPSDTTPVVTEPSDTTPVVTEPSDTNSVVTEPSATNTTEPSDTTPVVTEPVAKNAYSYLPSPEQAMAGYNFRLVVQDNKGDIITVPMTQSNEIVNGVRVYTAYVPENIVPVLLNYQVMDGSTFVSQITVSPDVATNKSIIRYDGSAVNSESTDTTPVVTEPSDTNPVVTEPSDTTPVVTEPSDTTPVVTEPSDTTPVVTEPSDTTPVVTEPSDTTPVVTEPSDTTPVDTGDTTPSGTTPSDATTAPTNGTTAPTNGTTAPTEATTAAPTQGTTAPQATVAPATVAPATVAPAAQTPTAAVSKADNTMTVKAKKITAKAGKKVTVKTAKAFKVNNAVGKVTFKKVKGNKKITVSKAGKIVVRKGLKKGTYTIKVKVTAKGDASTKKLTKTVKVKITVK